MNELNNPRTDTEARRAFGVVCRGRPSDFQMWLNSARTYEVYIIFVKSTRTGRLQVKEELQ